MNLNKGALQMINNGQKHTLKNLMQDFNVAFYNNEMKSDKTEEIQEIIKTELARKLIAINKYIESL